MHEISQIDPTTPFLHRRKAAHLHFDLIDVREVDFLERSSIAGSKLLKKVR